MYLWDLVGRDAPEGSPRSGIGGDLGAVMRTVEAELTQFPGFSGRVTEVVQRMSVLILDTVHVPTGREWLTRQAEDGGVYWEGRYRPAGPDVACDVTAIRGASAAG